MGTLKHRRWSVALVMGFAVYIFIYVAVQQVLFSWNMDHLHGIYYQNYIPGSSLFCDLFDWYLGMHLPLNIWLLSAAIMIPFGCFLFLMLEDCYSYYSIGLITFILTGVMNLADYFLLAPVFDIDFIFSSLIGSFVGYVLTVLVLKMAIGRKLHLILEEAPQYRRVT